VANAKGSRRATRQKKTVTKKEDPDQFPIVGIGSSAGGLEALEQFFKNTVPNSGIAYILISHLDPNRPSILADLIGHYTSMAVLQATDGMPVEADKIYVIPPGKDMEIRDRTLRLFKRPKQKEHEVHMPIDFFLRSLAEDQGQYAIAIVLSGNGSDGSFGLRSVQANLGLVMVQSPDTAKYDSMPRSAISTGLADYVVPPNDMFGMLEKYIRTLKEKMAQTMAKGSGSDTEALYKIMSILRTKTGHDFSMYKRNTINRRIERRMAVHQLHSFLEYAEFLRKDLSEVQMLFKELLIQVTKFFRDPEAFDALKKALRGSMLSDRIDRNSLRIWVPGCSTGEEVYSIAMLLVELMEEAGRNIDVQIFGTDIDENAIGVARTAEYPVSIAPDVGEERLKRFFTKEEDKFKVKKEVRDMAIFAPQNIIRDPPFIRLDMISCRNLLIYFEPALQRKVLETLSFALNPDGLLFLGTSETINGFSDEFTVIDQKWKIYRRVPYTQPFTISDIGTLVVPSGQEATNVEPGIKVRPRISEVADRALLMGFAPPGLIVDSKDEIVNFHGKTGKYLEHPPGKASLNIQTLLKEDIKFPVMAAIREARSTMKVSVKNAIRVKANGDSSFLNIVVKPIEDLASIGGLMIVFQDIVIPNEILREHQGLAIAPDKDVYITELEKELSYTKENLQSTIEELETSNEELKSTNEELQSTNEELQSVAEESETAKEELHSLNEELLSVNAELEKRNEELQAANSDMRNLLNSIDVATIFLDTHLKIKRFTPQIGRIMNLLPSDMGRPIADITMSLRYDDLINDAEEVLDRLVTKEKEIQTKEGQWFQVRILPYRTVDNVIDGVVITVIDIDMQKKVQEKLEQMAEELTEAREYAEGIVNMIGEPLIVLDQNLEVVSANHSFYRTFSAMANDVIGYRITNINGLEWQNCELDNILESALDGHDITEHPLTISSPSLGSRKALISAKKLPMRNGKKQVLLTFIIPKSPRSPGAYDRS
jgi:two-component system CheB/CheR fusion protein